jgi:hypothetical protein
VIESKKETMNKLILIVLTVLSMAGSALAQYQKTQLTTNVLSLGTNGQVLVILPGGGIGWTVRVDQAQLDATNTALLALIATKVSQSTLDATNTALLANDAALSNNLYNAYIAADVVLSNALYLVKLNKTNDTATGLTLEATTVIRSIVVSNAPDLNAVFVTPGLITATSTNLTNGVLPAMTLSNSTPAVANGQSYTPMLRMAGNGWKTTATAASQPVWWDLYGVPVQGSASPSGIFKIVSVVNGATSSTNLQLTSGGNLSVSGNMTGGAITATSGVTASGGNISATTGNISTTAGSITAGGVAGNITANGLSGVIVGTGAKFNWGAPGDYIGLLSAGIVQLVKGANTNAALLYGLAPMHMTLTNITELGTYYGAVYDNLTAAGPQTNTLPTISTEVLGHNWFVCLTNNILAVTASGGAVIAYGKIITPANGTVYTSATNSAIHITAVSSSMWLIDSLTGFWTNSAGVYLNTTVVTNVLTGSATLDFPNTANWTNADLSITVTGALPGDPCYVGVPGGSVPPNGHYSWWTTNDAVQVRFHNTGTNGAIARDPASGTFKAVVWKF